MAYKKIKELGRGNFGIVDLVEDDDGTQWARKTFAPPTLPGVSGDELRQRFEREVRYQSQLNHPNVVRIVDSDLTANPPWFVMELADCSLADMLAKDRTLGGDPRKPLFDILAGLQALHEKGYRHRDLKPANVLRFVDEDGDERFAISDFGLMTPGDSLTSTLTASNMGGGTPLYRAPECAINFRRATNQSDIYSFGAILHDIFGGGAARLPHVELTVNGDLGPIVQKCTKQNVRRRYESVGLLREALYAVLSVEIPQFSSPEEEEVVKLLEAKDALDDQEWDRVFQQIDDNVASNRSNHEIFRAVTTSHLNALAEAAPELFSSLGRDYARYAQTTGFDFDYCDVIANNAQVFYDKGGLDLQAQITLALLELGTSHNRWFVESKFMKMAGETIATELAERIKVEVEVQDIDFERQIEHVERSIRTTRKRLHPLLQEILPPDED